MSGHRFILWDLENTLYPYSPGFGAAAQQALVHTIADLDIDMSPAQAWSFAQPTFPLQTISRLQAMTGRSQYELFLRFHDHLAPDFISPDPLLAHEMRHCTARHALITHSSRRFAERALAHMGLSEAFPPDLRITSEDMRGLGKNDDSRPVLLALQRLGAQAEESLMVDDRDKNLMHPRALGLATVLVGNRGEEHEAQHCHYFYPTAGSFLRAFNMKCLPALAPAPAPFATPALQRKRHDRTP